MHDLLDLEADEEDLPLTTAVPLDDVALVEDVLDAWRTEGVPEVPEFWCWQMLDNLSNLFGAIQAALCREDRDGLYADLHVRSPALSSALAYHREETRTLLVEIREIIDQLWSSDWPTISSALERDVRDLLGRVRDNEAKVATLVQGALEVAPNYS